MSIVELKCADCGAKLKLSQDGKSATCTHCGATVVITQDDLKAINETHSLDNVVKRADTFLSINEYSRAVELYFEATEIAPDDYRGWFGMSKCKILNYYNFWDKTYDTDMDKALKFAPDSVKEQISAEYNELVSNFIRVREEANKNMAEEIAKAKGEIVDIEPNFSRKKNFLIDFLISYGLIAVGIVGLVLGVMIDFAQIIFLAVGVICALVGASLLYSSFRWVKVTKRIEAGEFATVSALQTALKEEKKTDVLDMLSSLIKNAHLVGVSVVGGEQINVNLEAPKTEEKVAPVEEKKAEEVKPTEEKKVEEVKPVEEKKTEEAKPVEDEKVEETK